MAPSFRPTGIFKTHFLKKVVFPPLPPHLPMSNICLLKNSLPPSSAGGWLQKLCACLPA